MCTLKLVFCYCCKNILGTDELTKRCKNSDNVLHKRIIKHKFVRYCDNCCCCIVLATPYNGKRPPWKQIERFDRFKNKLPLYTISNIPNRPEVKFILTSKNGDEQVYLKDS